MENSVNSHFEIIYDQDGNPINLTINGKSVYSRNIKRQADLWHDQSVAGVTEDFLIVFGFGLGVQLERLLKEKSDERIIYLVVEDRESFIKLHGRSGLNLSLFQQIFALDELQKLYDNLAQTITIIAKKGIRVIDFPPISNALGSQYENFLKGVSDVLNVGKINFNTMGILGPQMEINQAINIIRSLKYPGIKELKGVLGDYPVVIVGAGPSLTKNLDVLREHQDNVFIIAVGRVVKLLHEKGINPDMVCIIDPNELQYDYISGVDLKDTFLMVDHKASYKVFQMVQAKFWAFDRNDSLTNWLRRFTPPKGKTGDFFNVAQFAALLAYHLTGGPIAMMGVDLSFSSRTHADGVIMSQHFDPSFTSQTMWVAGNVEEKVATMPNMYSMIKFFELTIRNNRMIYNVTEGGARIEGTEITTLKSFIKEFCHEQKYGTVSRISDLYRVEQFGKEDIELIKNNIDSILNVLFSVQKGYQKGLGYVEKLKKYSLNVKKNGEKINSYLSKIDRLHEDMYQLAEKAGGFVEGRTAQSEILLRTRRDETLKYKEKREDYKVVELEINRFGKYFESMIFHVEYAAHMLLNMSKAL